MSCLAQWKDGSSRYLVAMMNHSHVYTDEARYRCFVFQKVQPGKGGVKGRETVFKMAQSNQASCLGLWSVDEGYKTFTLKKRKSQLFLQSSLRNYVINHTGVRGELLGTVAAGGTWQLTWYIVSLLHRVRSEASSFLLSAAVRRCPSCSELFFGCRWSDPSLFQKFFFVMTDSR